MGPELALAASAREWPDVIHRFLVDHGGGRVRSRVMGPDQALADEFDVLIIDDICSFLSPRLVSRLRDQGKEIIGVFSPSDGPDAKRRLLECGISDVIEADATPDEFLTLVASAVAYRATSESSVVPSRRSFLIGLFGHAGAGVTEVAVALSVDLSSRHSTVLLDLDLERPAIAQRLDLPLHPNLRTAIDYAHHDQAKLDDAIHSMNLLSVVIGVPAGENQTTSVAASEVRALVDDLSGGRFAFVVLDLGDRIGLIEPGVLDMVIAVGDSSPVGLTRLIRDVSEVGGRTERPEVLALVNRAPRPSRRADEIRRELTSALHAVPVIMIRGDRRVGQAAWDGRVVSRGPFTKATGRIGKLLSGSAGP